MGEYETFKNFDKCKKLCVKQKIRALKEYIKIKIISYNIKKEVKRKNYPKKKYKKL